MICRGPGQSRTVDDAGGDLRSRRLAAASGKHDGWPAISRLITLAFHDDNDIATLASQELLARLDWPALPLAHGGQRKVIRKVAQQSAVVA
jgi:hypothetical protein